MEEELERDMKPKLIEDLGMRYPTGKSKHKTRLGIYECQYCMQEFVGHTYNIKSGSAKSCGCQKHKPREKSIKHGLRSNRFYSTWRQMLQRCNNHADIGYIYYGARGITVCEEWLDIRNFVDWAEKTYPNLEGYTLDRIDVNMGYSPNNCRWADIITQNINQRMKKSNTSGYTGVSYHKTKNKWTANIGINNKLKHLGQFDSKEEAVQARDNYIIENNLPHKLSTDYKKEES